MLKDNSKSLWSPLLGGRPKNITSHPAFEHVPSFSADGKWIYFSSTRTGNYEIWKVQLAGGDPVQVTRHGGWSPFESAAGAYLYYTQTAAGGSSQPLWRISTSGGQPVKVLDSVDNLRLRSLGNGFVSAEFRIDSDAVDSGVAGWYHLELGMIGDQWKIYAEEKVQPFSRVVPRN
jgi:Tol biopolymer transport system component